MLAQKFAEVELADVLEKFPARPPASVVIAKEIRIGQRFPVIREKPLRRDEPSGRGQRIKWRGRKGAFLKMDVGVFIVDNAVVTGVMRLKNPALMPIKNLLRIVFYPRGFKPGKPPARGFGYVHDKFIMELGNIVVA